MAILILTHVCSTEGKPWHTHFSRYIFIRQCSRTLEGNTVWFNLFFHIKKNTLLTRSGPDLLRTFVFVFPFSHHVTFFRCAFTLFSHSYQRTPWCCFNQLWFIFIHHLFLRWLRSPESTSVRLGLSIHRSRGIFHHHLFVHFARSHLSETHEIWPRYTVQNSSLADPERGVELSAPQHKISSRRKIFRFCFWLLVELWFSW